MFIKFLAGIDIIIALIFGIQSVFDVFPVFVVLYAGGALITKALFLGFNFDFASIMDIISGIIILLSLVFLLPVAISIIVIFYLFQKNLFCFFPE